MPTSDGSPFSAVPYASFTNFTPVLPAFYYDVYSSEQRIKAICMEIDKLQNYADYLSGKISDLNIVSPDELAEATQKLEDEIAELKAGIANLAIGVLQWDVQHGDYRSTSEAQRDMFNDLAVHAITVSRLNSLDMTVKDLADCGLNVRDLAVMSDLLVEKFGTPEEFEAAQFSGDGSILSAYKLIASHAQSAATAAQASATAAATDASHAQSAATAAQANAETAVDTANAAQAYVQDALVHLTQAEYDALTTKVDTTVYLVG